MSTLIKKLRYVGHRISFFPMLLVFVLLSNHTQLAYGQGNPTISENDSLALVAIYDAMGGDSWRNTQNQDRPWKVGPANTWKGVIIENLRVVDLRMNSNNLTGEISNRIADLDALRTLMIIGNALSGEIPGQTMASLGSLEVLSLSFSQLEGEIPIELGSLKSLTQLSLGNNALRGGIPEALTTLPNLVYLNLENNQLDGAIPEDLGKLSQLGTLALGGNDLSDSIPSKLGDLKQLKLLSLSGNKLEGAIPSTLGGMTSLEQLHLGSNQLSKVIPGSLGNLENLLDLFLDLNQLEGSIPASIGKLKKLRHLTLAGNRLSGKVPTALGEMGNLQILGLDRNQLEGEIPAALGKLSNLRTLAMSSNQLTGAIPTDLGKLSNLHLLFLSRNQLTGSIPKELGALTNLTQLGLGENQLEGSIPAELGNLTELTVLSLFANRLSGVVPKTFTQLNKLRELLISINQLERLPDLSSLPELRTVRFEANRFTFRDLEPNAEIQASTFTYAPQADVDTHIQSVGGKVQFYVSVGGEHTMYKWFRDDEVIVEGVDSTYTPAMGGTGIYHSESTNDKLPNLVLSSRPIGGTVFVVNSQGDAPLKENAESGVCDTGETIIRVTVPEPKCTLRAAIQAANKIDIGQGAEPVPAYILFDILQFATIPVIQPDSALTLIKKPLIIDGTTQPGAGRVRLDGSMAGDDVSGLSILAGNSKVSGMLIEGFAGNGVFLSGLENGYTVSGCFIVNNGEFGIVVEGSNTTIRNNVLSGNEKSGVAIELGSSNNLLENNTIGLEEDGLSALPNKAAGISILDGTSVVKNNVISANKIGILISSLALGNPSGNQIEENIIGGTKDEQAVMGNEVGIYLGFEASETIIRNNAILDNTSSGVLIEGGTGKTRPTGNRIENNLVAQNRLGIIMKSGDGNWIMNNRIAGNESSGIILQDIGGDQVTGTKIQENQIGLLFDESGLEGNGEHGIEVEGSSDITITSNTISGNIHDGIHGQGAGVVISENQIGTNASGDEPFGNGGNGIFIQSGKDIELRENIISANGRSGVMLDGKGSSVYAPYLRGNKIGTDSDGGDPLGVMGNREHGVHIRGVPEGSFSGAFILNDVSFNNETGIFLESSDNFRLRRNMLHNNVTGIRIVDGEKLRVVENRIHLNQRNIDAVDTIRELIIENNDVFNGTGTGTGLHLTRSHALVRGNQFWSDAGDAITLEQGSTASISNNNIFDNQGFGLNNRDASIIVEAQSNWWGDASGPAGNGPGSGDPVSAGVDFANWRSEMVAVVAAIEQDTLFVPIAKADTVSVFLQNWQVRDDVLDLTLTDPQGWFQGSSSFSVSLIDSLGAEARLPFSIPGNTAEGTQNTVEVIATSQTNPTHADTTSFTLIAQSTTLAQLFIVPDSIAVVPGDTVRFAALGFDQFGSEVAVAPVWSTTGGVIDAEGVYVAGNLGQYTVTATDPTSQLQAEAIVSVLTSVDVEDEVESPLSFSLEPNYPNPFNPRTTIRYTVAQSIQTRLVVYDMLGRQVAVLVDEVQEPGSYEVSFDARGLPSGVYVYRMMADVFQETRTMLLVK